MSFISALIFLENNKLARKHQQSYWLPIWCDSFAEHRLSSLNWHSQVFFHVYQQTNWPREINSSLDDFICVNYLRHRLSIKTGVIGWTLRTLQLPKWERNKFQEITERFLCASNDLKFVSSLLLLCFTILSLFWQAQAVEFQCEYGYRLDHGYPCQITKGKLESDNEAVTFVGKHQAGKDDNDLKLISFSGNRLLRLHYFPREAFITFPQLNDFSLQHCQLRNLKNGDFQRAGNLKNLNLDSNELTQLNASTFVGATKLEWLSASSNFIDTINKDAFKGLSKLQMLILSQNKLRQLNIATFYELVDLREILLDGNGFETLPAGLFDRNLQMKRVWLQKNQLKVIEPQIFAPLENLVFVNLEDNVCINELFRKQYRETELMLTEALKNCNLTPAAKGAK